MGYTSFVSKLAALGIAGISVDICGVESNGTEDVYTSATTIALPFNAGYFLADKVPVGTYRVKVDQSSLPANFLRFTTSVDQFVTVAGNECAPSYFGILPLPTYIALMAFNATPAPEGVSVTWSTGVEEDHLGFQLYRSPAINGARVPVGSFFHSLAAGPGASYSLLDAGAQSGRYFYWLEDVGFREKRTVHGPARVELVSAAVTASDPLEIDAAPVEGLVKILASEGGVVRSSRCYRSMCNRLLAGVFGGSYKPPPLL
ncbi:MAG: hypothetical protein ACI9TH_000098 [Kiritimatiellia bacterium]|jgi:hypothetical protein